MYFCRNYKEFRMEILTPELDNYITLHTSEEPQLLAELRRETYQKTTQPHMISGVYQGRLLSMLSKMVNPMRILEIGTFTGYATLCLAEGLTEEGKIITLDINEELAYLPKKHFEKSGLGDKIQFILENALDYLDKTDEKFDLVFIDADKQNYFNYFEKVLTKMNSGGIILADNVLWHGKVLEETPAKDKKSAAIKEFNQKVVSDPRVEVVFLPLRDGISLIRKR